MIRKLILFIFLLIFSAGCSPTLRHSYAKLSPPEKGWVIFHPFKASKAYGISKEAEKVKDSISKVDIIGNDNNGGKLDAFKHSFWMARLTQSIGNRAAMSLGNAHEKGNYTTYKKGSLEDGLLPDKQSTDMDLHNNSVGNTIGINNLKSSRSRLIEVVMDSLHKGSLKILNKNNEGFFLDCDDKIIPLDSLKNKWNTRKCLVPSNQ